MAGQLNAKQEAFAQHYAMTGNATESYRTAGYKGRHVHRRAIEVLQNSNVSARISELQQRVRKDAEEKFDLTVELITQAYMDIAFFDPADIYTWDEKGNMKMKTPDQLTPRQRRLIGHLQRVNGKSSTLEVRANDRMKAMEALAKRIGFFELDNAQNAGNLHVTLAPEDAAL